MKGSREIISITFSYSRSSIRVSMGILEKLSLPVYIRFLVNASKKQFAVEATNKSDSSSIKIVYPMNKLTNGYVAHSQLLVEQIYAFMNWDITKRYRVYGDYIEKDDVAILDLRKGQYIENMKLSNRGKKNG